MPSIALKNVATTANAVDGLKFRNLPGPALISLYASGVTAGDVISLSVGNEDFLVNGQTNIEASADVVDTDRDQILFQEPVPAGELFIPITATTAVNFLVVIEPLV